MYRAQDILVKGCSGEMKKHWYSILEIHYNKAVFLWAISS